MHITDRLPALAHAIRTAREMRGLTQEVLPARIGVSQSTISLWGKNCDVEARKRKEGNSKWSRC